MAITDPEQASRLVLRVVTGVVGQQVGIPPHRVDITRTFVGDPPGGFGFNDIGALCDAITPILAKEAQRALRLSGDFRVAHKDDAIDAFCAEVTTELLKAPATDAIG